MEVLVRVQKEGACAGKDFGWQEVFRESAERESPPLGLKVRGCLEEVMSVWGGQ